MDTGKIFVDSSGKEVTGTSTAKADLKELKENIEALNDELEPVILGDGSGGGFQLSNVIGMIERTATKITLPSGLTKIGDHVFSGYSNLTSVNIPDSVTSIGFYAFNYCINLALTSLPEGLKSIDYHAFYECKTLALTSLPEGLKSIGNYTFYNCINLALTSLPEGLTEY